MKNKSILSDAFIIAAVFALLYLFYRIVGCPIRFLTGISCAGCGMTRACISAVRGQWHRAFYFHPLFVTVPFMAVLFLLRDCMSGRIKRILIFAFAAAFLVVYAIRMADPHDTVVVFEPQNGVLMKMLGILTGYIQ